MEKTLVYKVKVHKEVLDDIVKINDSCVNREAFERKYYTTVVWMGKQKNRYNRNRALETPCFYTIIVA